MVDATLAGVGSEILSGTLTATLDDAVLNAAGTVIVPVTGTLVTVLDDAVLLSVGTESFTGTLTVTLDDAVLLAAGTVGSGSPQVDITITGSLEPRRWEAALTDRAKTGTLEPRDKTGALTDRAKTGTLNPRRWKATL